jgi:hypothetical protein
MLLRRRQYQVLEQILRDDGSSLPFLQSHVYDIARLLAKHGFMKLLEAHEASKKIFMDDAEKLLTFPSRRRYGTSAWKYSYVIVDWYPA